MVISSRTPEGDPGQCSVCGHKNRLDPSLPGRDAPCASCGHLIWFVERGVLTSEVAELLHFGEMRFGPLPADAEEEVERVLAESGNEGLIDRVLVASSWEDFLSGS